MLAPWEVPHLSLPWPRMPISALLAFRGGRYRIAQGLVMLSLCLSVRWVLFLLCSSIVPPAGATFHMAGEKGFHFSHQ